MQTKPNYGFCIHSVYPIFFCDYSFVHTSPHICFGVIHDVWKHFVLVFVPNPKLGFW